MILKSLIVIVHKHSTELQGKPLSLSSQIQQSQSFSPHLFVCKRRSNHITTRCTRVTYTIIHFYGLQHTQIMQNIKLSDRILPYALCTILLTLGLTTRVCKWNIDTELLQNHIMMLTSEWISHYASLRIRPATISTINSDGKQKKLGITDLYCKISSLDTK